MSTENQYDAIVIGSGIGGMTVAGLLARFLNKRVLVLEKHFILGGLTHEFSRNGYSWSTGIHYIGQMSERQLPNKLLNYLTDGQLKWSKYPGAIDTTIYPDFRFAQPEGLDAFSMALEDQYPNEKLNIRRYFKDLKVASSWHRGYAFQNFSERMKKMYSSALSSPTQRDLSLMTTGSYLEKNISDPRLRALLTSTWQNHGLTPSESAFCIHSAVIDHYLDGAYYPAEGSGKIAKTILSGVISRGGQLVKRAEVIELLLSGDQVSGVKVMVQKGKMFETQEYQAPLVISAIGFEQTIKHILVNVPGLSDYVEKRLSFLNRFQKYSASVVYFGLKRSPIELGVDGSNYWLQTGYRYNAKHKLTDILRYQELEHLLLTFPSLHSASEQHTAIACIPTYFEDFVAWANSKWLKREDSYYEMKEQFKKVVTSYIERYVPGFTDLVDYSEVSTPLSIENFTSRPGGSMYGAPAVPERFTDNMFQPSTPIKGFYMAGSDLVSQGFVGGLMGGLGAASVIAGSDGFEKIVTSIEAIVSIQSKVSAS